MFNSDKNLFEEFSDYKETVKSLERQVSELTKQLEEFKVLTKSQLLRVKNTAEFSDDFIIKDTYYTDLSPEKAFDFYSEKDQDFILLDVCHQDFSPMADFPEATKIPLDELAERLDELPNSNTPILVISENGVQSILACKLLYKFGFFNINNISGGYKYWPGFNNLRAIDQKNISA